MLVSVHRCWVVYVCLRVRLVRVVFFLPHLFSKQHLYNYLVRSKYLLLLLCWRESVKPLQYYCQSLPLSYVVSERRLLFWRKMLISDNIVLAVLYITWHCVQICCCRQSVWNFYVDLFIRSKNQVTNMDDVCKFFDFAVFLCVLHFYVLFVLCVCVFLLCCFSFFFNFYFCLVRINTWWKSGT